MKTLKLKDVLPPKVEIKKSGNRLEILGNEELTKENHAFTFISVYGFEKLNGAGFFKNTDDFEETLRIVREYLTEQNFEFFGDKFCQEILDRLNNRERDFQGAKECGEGIKTNEPVNLEIPNFSIKRKLLPYQIRPVQHMIQVSNVANFSIPGSGKTTMAYAAYAILKSNSSVDQLFVVGPLSSFKPWEEEFTNCFDIPYENHVLRYAGSPSEREKLSSQFHDFEVILTNIPIVNNDFETLKANLFSGRKIMLVLDESHHIKSFAENATFANTMIGIGRFAKKRVILTGTPMPHNWPDLWSQITFLYPDRRVLGPRIAYRSMMERIHATTQISNEINFLWTRVTHKQMKDDLPKMNIIRELVPMSSLQNEIYRALAMDLAILENQSDIVIHELDEMRRVRILRLLQCVTNPATIMRRDVEFDLEPYQTDNISIMEKLDEYKEVPNKILKAATLATDCAEKGKNVVIWVVFRHNVEYLCTLLHEMNPIGISGEIPTETNDLKEIMGRDDLIQIFKNSKGKIMVATLGSIAESVSLHRNAKGEPVCQNAIYLERNFNAGQFMQSLFRLYRIGSNPNIPVNNIFLSSTFSDGITRTIDDDVDDRLTERTTRMFNLMNDEMRLAPLDMDIHNYTIDGIAQYFDESGDRDRIIKKVLKMIRNYQITNKI